MLTKESFIKGIKEEKQVSEEEIKNLRMNNIGDEISLFKAICGKREALNDN